MNDDDADIDEAQAVTDDVIEVLKLPKGSLAALGKILAYGERRERAGREAAAVVCDEVYREYGEAVRSTDTPAGHEAMKNKAAGAGECACRIRGGPESTP
jgi:hypothetical protein